MLQQTIENKLGHLSNGVCWIKEWLNGERREQAYKTLVTCRRGLKKIKNALDSEPSVVLYGASQCGKSHLVSSLLSVNNKPLQILTENERGEKEFTPFLTHINPQGGGEATGLITRFTTKEVSAIPGYSIKVRLMTIKDIVLMLCEGYYNDVTNRDPISVEDIKQQLKKSRLETANPAFTLLEEDDIWDIEEYFNAHISSDLLNIFVDSHYFNEVSQLVSSVTTDKLIELIAILWHNNSIFTKLFEDYIHYYRMIEFASEVYICKEALLNNTAQPNTLLNVGWLDVLNQNQQDLSLCYYDTNRNLVKKSFNKAYLAALGAEVVLQIDKGLEDSKIFLKYVDVLDFPGARGKENALSITDKTLPSVLRRGKVSYYFNKYSSDKEINILLFCFEPDNFEAKPMGDRLEAWIKEMVGKTPKEREIKIRRFKESPLFFVGTKFNKQLDYTTSDRPDNQVSLKERWDKWFNTHLYDSIITPNNTWFDSWTDSQPGFDNIFLLRDFRYSTSIYSGWTNDDSGKEKEEIVPSGYTHFRRDLRASFIADEFVQKHFGTPEVRWDEAASINTDGSQLIIDKLSASAEIIKDARYENFAMDVEEICRRIYEELDRYHHKDSSDANIKQALQNAGEVQAALAIAFGQDSYFFGKLMQNFMLSEGDIYKIFHDEFQHIDLVKQKDLGPYVYILMKAQGISPENKFDDNLNILAKAFEMTPENCKNYFESRNIDLKILFSNTDNGMRNFSQTLAEVLEVYWFEHWLGERHHGDLAQMLGETNADSTITMLHNLYTKLKMTNLIAQSIRQYVDKFGTNVDEIQEMVADMCAEMVNKFVANVGYTYMSGDAIQSLKDANEEQQLGLDFSYSTPSTQPVNPEAIAKMFEAMDDLDEIKKHMDRERLQYIPGYNSRIRWSELLKIGFVYTQDIPNYNQEANNQLGTIKSNFEPQK